MKRKFYFHRENSPLRADSVIYVVWVGESVREQRLLTQIVAWSFENHATFMSWRKDIDEYLWYEEERIFGTRGLLNFGLIRQHVTALELLEHIQANDWEAYEKTPVIPKNFIPMIRLSDPSRLRENDNQNEIISVSAEARKNLSHSHKQERVIIRFT